jgi:hypothetical protein
LFPLGLLLRFPRGIFPLPVSIITVQSTPDTYGHDITANGLPPKSSRPFCVTWFVSLFLLTFYSPFCRGVTLIYMKSCGAESFQSGRIWRYIGIY